jgi:hypothetical protein
VGRLGDVVLGHDIVADEAVRLTNVELRRDGQACELVLEVEELVGTDAVLVELFAHALRHLHAWGV